MSTITEILAGVPLFAAVAPDALVALAGHARLLRLAEGDFLFRKGAGADSLYIVLQGRVAVGERESGVGPLRIVDTVVDGGVVGWSWLVPPYRWRFDARAIRPTEAVHADAVRLRDTCDADPAVGYHLLQEVAQVMHERLAATQLRLVDVEPRVLTW